MWITRHCVRAHPGASIAPATPTMPPRATRALNVFFLALLPASLYAADVAARSTYEGQRITNVRFDPPAQPVSSDDLNRLLTWKPGDALHLNDVRATIKRLFATGSYATVDIATAPAN